MREGEREMSEQEKKGEGGRERKRERERRGLTLSRSAKAICSRSHLSSSLVDATKGEEGMTELREVFGKWPPASPPCMSLACAALTDTSLGEDGTFLLVWSPLSLVLCVREETESGARLEMICSSSSVERKRSSGRAEFRRERECRVKVR